MHFFPKQELLRSSPEKKERAWRDGWHPARELGARGVWMGTRLWSWGPAEFGCWMARAQELGARGVWMGGTLLWSWGGVWMGGTRLGAGGPRFWMAGTQLGAGGRGVWMGGTRLWSRAPAVLMHVPGTFNIDGLSAGWVTACTHIC